MNFKQYNPFYLFGTAMAPQLLLMVKLLTIGLISKGYFQLLPAPFLPFFSFFDSIPPTLFQITIKLLFAMAALMLLFNIKVKWSCLIIGLVFLIGTLASKAYFSNGKFFCALIYTLTALNTNNKRPWLLQLQLVIIYFGSGLNKLFEVDWRTGQYFDHWLIHIRQSQIYHLLMEYIPSKWLALGFSWSTILLELIVLPVTLSIKKWHRVGVWLGMVFHSLAFWISGLSFGIFFAGMLLSYLVFAIIPKKVVIKVGHPSNFSKKLYRFLWPIQPGNWVTAQDDTTKTNDAVFIDLSAGSKDFTFFQAVLNMFVYHPLTYLVLMAMLCLPFLPNMTQHLATLIVLVMFFPFYDFIKKPLILRSSK